MTEKVKTCVEVGCAEPSCTGRTGRPYARCVRHRHEREGALQRAWVAKNQDSARERNRAYGQKHRARLTLQARANRYGFTVEALELYLAGHPTCDVCPATTDLQLDHDHKTKHLRGVLCGPHNRALGRVDDDPDALVRLVAYLRAAA